MFSNNDLVCNKVKVEENIGRTIGKLVLSDYLKNYNYTVTDMPIDCYVDLKGTVSTTNNVKDFQIEVKQRNKTESQFIKYGYNLELKVEKYNRMLTESPNGTTLLYMVLLNESTAYIFNMKQLDWSKVEKFDWYIKNTQVDPYSSYKVYPTYKIPMDMAIATVDCSKYFKEYNNNNAHNKQTKEETHQTR